MKITAKIAELTGPRQLHFRDEILDEAALPPTHILARTLCSAISVGTELAAYVGLPPLRPGRVYPRLVGYCNVAEIVAAGSAVTDWRAGDRILTCQSHRSAFACSVDEIVARVPPSADIAQVSPTYLLQLGYNALLKGGFAPAHRVAVIGLGTIGIGTVALAASFGGRVAAFSDQADQRNLAHEVGALSVHAKTDAPPSLDADIVVTTSNRWSDWRLAMRLARRDGAVCVLGFPGRGEPAPEFNPLDSQFFYDKQLRLIACGMSPEGELAVKRNCEFLIERITSGRFPAARLLDGTHTWSELANVYEQLATRAGGGMSRVITWP